MDNRIAAYKSSRNVTTVSLWNGVVMGGGVGLSIFSTFVVATETIRFAMPEVNFHPLESIFLGIGLFFQTGIGFFCDVGASYFLCRMPGALGIYIALTGHQLDISDVIYCKLATHCCAAAELPSLEVMILACRIIRTYS